GLRYRKARLIPASRVPSRAQTFASEVCGFFLWKRAEQAADLKGGGPRYPSGYWSKESFAKPIVKLAIFGGTFDPIHAGHLRAARAAMRAFGLDRVLFVTSGNPPHKRAGGLTAFDHRFAMTALACAGIPPFVPSLLEAPRADGRPHYSIETANKVRKSLGPKDRLYFLIGLDAFLELQQWKMPDRLLDVADFVVVSRPGFSLQKILGVLAPRMIRGVHPDPRNGTVKLRQSELHILGGVNVPLSSHEIRHAIRHGRSVTGLLPRLVEEYIVKHRLYQTKVRGHAGQ
ncbi:MAG: nicotinate-nucleotide adenylyltransferase, partial [Terriglobia bacterium]